MAEGSRLVSLFLPFSAECTYLCSIHIAHVALDTVALVEKELPCALATAPRKALLRATKKVAEESGEKVANLLSWVKKREKIKKACSKAFRSGDVRPPLFPKCEDQLYLDFLHRREIVGLRVGGKWLQVRMLELVHRMHPPNHSNVDKFKATDGWCSKWKKRYRVRSKARTKKQATPVAERLGAIKEFHKFLQEVVFESGQVLPRQIYYMDQIPYAHTQPQAHRRSLNSIGRSCFLKVPFKSADKRFCSIQMTTCADLDELHRVPLAFILRGQGLQLGEDETALWSALEGQARIFYQTKAWADGDFMMMWLQTFAFDVRDIIEEDGFVILGMDGHGAQMTRRFQERCDELNIIPVYTPPNCTDVVAPVDAGCGATLKMLANMLYEADYEQKHKIYEDEGIKAKEKRMQAAMRVMAAWNVMKEDYRYLILQSFIKTGWFPLAPDGSQDHLVKIKDFPGYNFRN